MAEHKSRLRFRLRTLFLLLAVIAVPLAAWRAWFEPYRVQRATMRAIADAGGSYQTEAGGPAWLRLPFGEDWFQDVVLVDLSQGAKADQLEHVLQLSRLSHLYVSGSDFTDDHLARLRRLSELKEVVLTSTSVSRESVEALERDRPDVALQIGLSFDELTGLLSGAWFADSAWQLDVPASVRQWQGRRVQIVGTAYSMTPARWVTNAELQPRDVLVPKRWRVAVVLKSPIKARDYFLPAEVTAEGRLDIAPDLADHGHPAYRLSDATLSMVLP